MKKILSILFLMLLIATTLSCNAQKSSVEDEEMLVSLYTKYEESKFEYEKRDSVLGIFKNKLLKIIANPDYKESNFAVLDTNFRVSISKDRNLTIISWDWLNNGSWQFFESAYRYLEGDKIHTGYLNEKSDNHNGFKDGFYIEINKLPDNSYLVKGYGTHGGAKDFYVFRKLSLYNGKLLDCNSCFNGNETLVFEKWRNEKVKLEYSETTKTITYPEQIAVLKDGEDTGFLKTTGNLIILHYSNGMFLDSEKK